MTTTTPLCKRDKEKGRREKRLGGGPKKERLPDAPRKYHALNIVEGGKRGNLRVIPTSVSKQAEREKKGRRTVN